MNCVVKMKKSDFFSSFAKRHDWWQKSKVSRGTSICSTNVDVPQHSTTTTTFERQRRLDRHRYKIYDVSSDAIWSTLISRTRTLSLCNKDVQQETF